MYTVIGKQRKTGEYNGKAYDNTCLYVTYNNGKAEGLACATLKGKTENIGHVEVGAEITPYYDQYGNVIECR